MTHHTLQPTVLITPSHPAAPAAGGTLDVLVRVQAPKKPEHGDLAIRPRTPLRCVEYIAAGLTPQDQLAVVAYDDQVQVPVQLTAGGNAAAIRARLEGLDDGGSTDLFAGWEQGARLLEQGAAGTLSRVLLLSDGQANHGLCDAAQIEKHVAAWQARGVTTTTVGLGRAFNEDLMIAMSRAGGGQQYYGQTAEDLHAGFDEELSLLQALFLRQLRLKLVPAAGVICEPLGVVHTEPDGRVRLPDVAWGAEAWLLVRLHLSPAQDTDPSQPQPLLAVAFEALGDDGADLVQLDAMLSLPRVSAGDFKGMPEDELVARRRQEVEFAGRVEQARALLHAGDAKGAQRLLDRLGKDVAAHPWLKALGEALQRLAKEDPEMSAKEMRYSVMRASRSLAALDEHVLIHANEASIPAYLLRKTEEGKGKHR